MVNAWLGGGPALANLKIQATSQRPSKDNNQSFKKWQYLSILSLDFVLSWLLRRLVDTGKSVAGLSLAGLGRDSYAVAKNASSAQF